MPNKNEPCFDASTDTSVKDAYKSPSMYIQCSHL